MSGETVWSMSASSGLRNQFSTIALFLSDPCFRFLTNGLARRASNQLAEKLPIRPVVEASDSNGLRIRSQVMTDRMLAIPRERVPRVIGTIDPETRGQLNTALLIVPGLARY
jgi:hypothetical protein